MIIIENLLSTDEVRDFKTRLEAVPWIDGGHTAMGMAADVKHNAQADPEDGHVREMVNLILHKMGQHPTLVSAALPHRIFPPVFNRYRAGETYGYHVDAAIMRMPDSSEVIRSDVSMTLFLSQPDEYEGGELVISTEFGEQRVKCKAGDAVAYPSSSLHQVSPVTRGERLAVVTWMQSLVADSGVRQTLHQLDACIQSLVINKHVERAELDRLHNVYHNLVRHYAQL